MTDESRIVSPTSTGSEESGLSLSERARYAALSTAVREAERALREVRGIASEAAHTYKELSFEAGRARAIWRGKTAAARKAGDALKGARTILHQSVASAYREWKRRNRVANTGDHEQFLTELAQACGMEMRDLLRGIGYLLERRTPREREEDFRRYLGGQSMREIARSRGLRAWAVQKDIGKRRAEMKLSLLVDGGGGSGGGVTTSMLPLGGRPPNGNIRVVGPVEGQP